LGTNNGDLSLADAFDAAHAFLGVNRKTEYIYKNHLVHQLVFSRHSPSEASVLMELRAGRSIADVAVFNGTSTVYEIKTEYDSFARLESQLSDYECRFDLINLVVHERMAQSAIDYVPDHVGVVCLTSRGELHEVQSPTSNLSRVDPAKLFGVLRQSEVLRILERTLYYSGDTTPANQWERTRDLFSSLEVEVAHREVVDELRRRGEQLASLARTMPYSLAALACATNQSGKAASRLKTRLSMSVSDARSLDM
jgi:hypothetical protein